MRVWTRWLRLFVPRALIEESASSMSPIGCHWTSFMMLVVVLPDLAFVQFRLGYELGTGDLLEDTVGGTLDDSFH